MTFYCLVFLAIIHVYVSQNENSLGTAKFPVLVLTCEGSDTVEKSKSNPKREKK